jgi:surfactin family lipopeptide synthetase A
VPGDTRLVAYLVAEGEQRDTATLRDALLRSLPDYMVPAHFVFLDAMPLTPNGKIDRRALPAPDTNRSEQGYVAPRTATEEALARIWAEVLKLDRVGVHDNFFELGGNSLLLVTLHQKIKKSMADSLTIVDLLSYSTIEKIGHYMDNAASTAETLSESSVRGEKRRRQLTRQRAAL